MAITREVTIINEFREHEIITSDVVCPECGSLNVWFTDEDQPCDGVNIYDGLTYSICCEKCGHLFYDQEDINTNLY